MIELAADGYPKILPAYEDGVFKSIFTRPENKLSLADIISSFTGIPVEDVTVRGSELPIKDIGVKREIFDINCTATDGKSQFAIEMQADPMERDNAKNEHANVRCRSVYCLADLHSNQAGRGLDYSGFAKSYQITISNYSPFKERHGLLEEFLLRNERGLVLADAIRAIFVDLSLVNEIVKKPVRDMTAAEMWAIFIAKASEPEYYGLLNEIIENKEAILMVQESLNSISMDENERARYRSRRIWELDREHEQAVWRQDAEAAKQETEIEKLR